MTTTSDVDNTPGGPVPDRVKYFVASKLMFHDSCDQNQTNLLHSVNQAVLNYLVVLHTKLIVHIENQVSVDLTNHCKAAKQASQAENKRRMKG